MEKGYQLLVRYMHCIGPKDYSVSHVDTKKEAQEWVKKHQTNGRSRFKVPGNDPVRWCPVKHCHMKSQTPSFFFRSIEKPS